MAIITEEQEQESEKLDLIDEYNKMSVDKKKKATSSYYSMKSHYPCFPDVFPDQTGHQNIMINLYFPLVHKSNFVMEINKKGTKLHLGTNTPPIFLTRKYL
jgi:hypothetical protein